MYRATVSEFYLLHPHMHVLIPDLDDQLAGRLAAGEVGLSLFHALGSEGVLAEDVDLHDTLAHYIEEELRVVSALLRSDHVVRHGRTEKLDVLLHKLERRERWDSTGSISEANEGPFPLQELEVIVESVYGDQHTSTQNKFREKGTYVSFPTPSNTTFTPTPSVISNTLCTVSSLLYKMT